MEIIASVLGGLVGGLFTFLGVLLTIKYEKQKEKKREKEKLAEIEANAIKDKPRLEIIKYNALCKPDNKKRVDANILLCRIVDHKNNGSHCFYYDEDIINTANWVSVEYLLKNTGNTEIEYLYFSTNLVKSTALFNVSNEENVFCYSNKLLSYRVYINKNLKPGETIKVRVNYISDKIIESNIGSAPICIWLVDVNKRWWAQALFAPQNMLYNSEKSSFEEWKGNTDEFKAMECFDDPTLW